MYFLTTFQPFTGNFSCFSFAFRVFSPAQGKMKPDKTGIAPIRFSGKGLRHFSLLTAGFPEKKNLH